MKRTKPQRGDTATACRPVGAWFSFCHFPRAAALGYYLPPRWGEDKVRSCAVCAGVRFGFGGTGLRPVIAGTQAGGLCHQTDSINLIACQSTFNSHTTPAAITTSTSPKHPLLTT